jgi:hypothetical protein
VGPLGTRWRRPKVWSLQTRRTIASNINALVRSSYSVLILKASKPRASPTVARTRLQRPSNLPRNCRAATQPARNMARFNPSSGLVYEETLAPVRSMVPRWTTDSRGRRVDPSKFHQPHCDRLHSMALRACIWNIHNMEPGALQWLGWWYASRLYSHLKSTWVTDFMINPKRTMIDLKTEIRLPSMRGTYLGKLFQRKSITM